MTDTQTPPPAGPDEPGNDVSHEPPAHQAQDEDTGDSGVAVEIPLPSPHRQVLGDLFASDAFRNAVSGFSQAEDIARIFRVNLPNLIRINAPVIPMPKVLFGDAFARGLMSRQTEDFLRNVRLQIPAFNFGNLISPEVRAGLARISESLKRLIPENLSDFSIDEWVRLIEISEEQRIAVAWVPRTEVLRALLDAEDEQARADVTHRSEARILEDCVRSLDATEHPDLQELITFAHQAIQTHQAGHTAAAQALATNVLDTALEQHHQSGVKGMLAACKRLHAKDPDEATLLEIRLRLVTAGIPRSYRDYKYDDRDPRYSRNGTAHAVNAALYSPQNSLRAITLATTWLRWLDDTWTEAEASANPATA